MLALCGVAAPAHGMWSTLINLMGYSTKEKKLEKKPHMSEEELLGACSSLIELYLTREVCPEPTFLVNYILKYVQRTGDSNCLRASVSLAIYNNRVKFFDDSIEQLKHKQSKYDLQQLVRQEQQKVNDIKMLYAARDTHYSDVVFKYSDS